MAAEPRLREHLIVKGEPPMIVHRWFTPLERKTAIVDISNVAWQNRNEDAGEKATLNNVLILLKALSALSFETVIGIADASLPHQIDEAERVEELRSVMELTLTPANQSADPHILEVARKRNAVIITNDKYREWIELDPWNQENVPRVLFPYEIQGGEVVFDEKAIELER